MQFSYIGSSVEVSATFLFSNLEGRKSGRNGSRAVRETLRRSINAADNNLEMFNHIRWCTSIWSSVAARARTLFSWLFGVKTSALVNADTNQQQELWHKVSWFAVNTDSGLCILWVRLLPSLFSTFWTSECRSGADGRTPVKRSRKSGGLRRGQTLRTGSAFDLHVETPSEMVRSCNAKGSWPCGSS